MRCPKCGFISFDNVEKCLKCKKNIADTAKLFQGSVYNVMAPVFLQFGEEEEETSSELDAIEELEADEDFEITDPDLEILLTEDEEGEEADLSLEDDEAGVAFDDEEDLITEFSEIKAFAEEATGEDDIGLNLGMMEDGAAEMAFDSDADGDAARGAALKIPDDLADISDLSPPKKADFADQAKSTGGAADSLDEELDLSGLEEELGSFEPASTASPAKEKSEMSLDMDEELDFELDLGGLSIHDDK